jgi:hypothetical protein
MHSPDARINSLLRNTQSFVHKSAQIRLAHFSCWAWETANPDAGVKDSWPARVLDLFEFSLEMVTLTLS